MNAANVEFEVGDPAAMEFSQPFDAIVGRLVLMYYPDPVAALKSLSRHLRPGGVLAFQEFDYPGARSHPPSALYDQCIEWIRLVFDHSGADLRMGARLYSAFLAAGLPAPSMRLDASVGSGKGHLSYLVVTEVVRTILPVLQSAGIASADEVAIDSLRDRLEADVLACGSVVISPSLIGAWARP